MKESSVMCLPVNFVDRLVTWAPSPLFSQPWPTMFRVWFTFTLLGLRVVEFCFGVKGIGTASTRFSSCYFLAGELASWLGWEDAEGGCVGIESGWMRESFVFTFSLFHLYTEFFFLIFSFVTFFFFFRVQPLFFFAPLEKKKKANLFAGKKRLPAFGACRDRPLVPRFPKSRQNLWNLTVCLNRGPFHATVASKQFFSLPPFHDLLTSWISKMIFFFFP